jgi:hypothetical protein
MSDTGSDTVECGACDERMASFLADPLNDLGEPRKSCLRRKGIAKERLIFLQRALKGDFCRDKFKHARHVTNISKALQEIKGWWQEALNLDDE